MTQDELWTEICGFFPYMENEGLRNLLPHALKEVAIKCFIDERNAPFTRIALLHINQYGSVQFSDTTVEG